MSEERAKSDAALDEAAAWVGRLRSDSVTGEDKEAFSQWFARSEHNRDAFDRVFAMWQDLAVVEVLPFDTASAPQARGPTWSLGALFQSRLALAATCAATLAALAITSALLLRAPTYETAVGEQATHLLADGSRLLLNTDTSIDVDFDESGRALELIRGEAFFEVASNKDRPFIVEACDSRVIAVGTAFNVLCHEGDLKVTVTEGEVQVSARSGVRLLGGNEQLSLKAGTPEAVVERVAATTIASWRNQLHVYDGVPLSEVVDDLNRYSETKIRVFDPSLAAIRVVARYRMADRASTLASLEKTFPLRVVPISESEVALVPTP